MKSLLLFGVLFLFVITSSGHRLSKEENRCLQGYCGKQVVPARTRRSIHTRLASRSEAPWVVAMQLASKWHPNITLADRKSETMCSGSLISPRHVILAAHCIDGMFYYSAWEMEFPVNKMFYSSNYQGMPCAARIPVIPSGDIAIFELKEDVPFSDLVYPACLNERELRNGEKLTQFGYGLSNDDPDAILNAPTKLRIFESVVSDCGSVTPSPDTLCDFNKYKSACGGDSGSGKMAFDRRGVASVAAITSSAGMGCSSFLEAQGKGPHASSPAYNINVINHLHLICAATGICVSREIEEDVEEYERLGFVGGNSTKWYNTLLPLKDDEIYA